LEKARRSTAVSLPMAARRNSGPTVPVAARMQPSVRTSSSGNAGVQNPWIAGPSSRQPFSSPSAAFTRPAERPAPQMGIPRNNAPQARLPATAARPVPQGPAIQRQAPAVSVPQSQPARPVPSTPRASGMESMRVGPR
jgi:hypothetical protein